MASCQCLSRSRATVLLFACPKRSRQEKGPPDEAALRPLRGLRVPCASRAGRDSAEYASGMSSRVLIRPALRCSAAPTGIWPPRNYSANRRGAVPSKGSAAAIPAMERAADRRDTHRRRAGSPSAAPSIAGFEGQGPKGTGHGRPVLSRRDRMSRRESPLEAEKRREPRSPPCGLRGAAVGGPFLLVTFLWASKDKQRKGTRARKTLAQRPRATTHRRSHRHCEAPGCSATPAPPPPRRSPPGTASSRSRPPPARSRRDARPAGARR